MNYGYSKEVTLPFSDAVTKVKEELKTAGFGVLTEIDVAATLKQKLDVDYGQYIILGACNPSLAYEALEAEKEIGLLLPCNVIVYEYGNKVYVSVILPTAAMQIVENKLLQEIAAKVEVKLKAAIDSIK